MGRLANLAGGPNQRRGAQIQDVQRKVVKWESTSIQVN